MFISGVYEKTMYRSEKTNRTVLRLRLNEMPTEDFEWLCVVCEGELVYPLINMPIRLSGEFTDMGNNKNEFPTFAFTDVELITTSEEEIRLLPSFKGVGEETLRKLIDAFGMNVFTWREIPNLFEKLTQVEGIGPKRAQSIIEGTSFYANTKEFIEFCFQYGENPYLDKNEKPSEMLDKLKEHPYEYGKKCKLSFRVCDSIARDCGFTVNSWERVKALVVETLTRAENAGNTCFPMERTFKGVEYYEDHNSAFVHQKVSEYVVFAILMNSPDVIVPYINEDEETYFFLEEDYFNERLLANNIKRLQGSNLNFNVDVKKTVARTQMDLGITYNASQKEAFNFLASSGLKILTGGPGTGKTTVINGICHAYSKLFPTKTIAMMAPTGRAAQRMSEVTGRDAGTLHRTFKLKTGNIAGTLKTRMTSDFTANYPADLIIIDETSMLDDEWAAFTLSSLKSGSTCIFVGDIDQLPSVGAGNVLHDIINSGKCDIVKLDVNYRSGNLSTIAKNAGLINNGETELVSDDTFVISKCPDMNTMKSRVKQIFYKEYDPKDPFKCQILNAVKDGRAGVYDYNRMAQSTVNKTPTLIETDFTEFKRNDKVIITKNNYDDFCFNGDIGTVTDCADGEITIDLGNNKTVVYGPDKYNELSLAYSMSIHKSQGSEYDTAIIVLPEETSGMLKRNLLYTAVTRAKKKVYIFYMGNALNKAILSSGSSRPRETRLTEMLNKEM